MVVARQKVMDGLSERRHREAMESVEATIDAGLSSGKMTFQFPAMDKGFGEQVAEKYRSAGWTVKFVFVDARTPQCNFEFE